MASPAHLILSLSGTAGLGMLLAWSPTPQEAPEGFAIDNETVIDRCSRCHAVDDEGRMSRISYLRKTPEGWQTSIRLPGPGTERLQCMARTANRPDISRAGVDGSLKDPKRSQP